MDKHHIPQLHRIRNLTLRCGSKIISTNYLDTASVAAAAVSLSVPNDVENQQNITETNYNPKDVDLEKLLNASAANHSDIELFRGISKSYVDDIIETNKRTSWYRSEYVKRKYMFRYYWTKYLWVNELKRYRFRRNNKKKKNQSISFDDVMEEVLQRSSSSRSSNRDSIRSNITKKKRKDVNSFDRRSVCKRIPLSKLAERFIKEQKVINEFLSSKTTTTTIESNEYCRIVQFSMDDYVHPFVMRCNQLFVDAAAADLVTLENIEKELDELFLKEMLSGLYYYDDFDPSNNDDSFIYTDVATEIDYEDEMIDFSLFYSHFTNKDDYEWDDVLVMKKKRKYLYRSILIGSDLFCNDAEYIRQVMIPRSIDNATADTDIVVYPMYWLAAYEVFKLIHDIRRCKLVFCETLYQSINDSNDSIASSLYETISSYLMKWDNALKLVVSNLKSIVMCRYQHHLKAIYYNESVDTNIDTQQQQQKFECCSCCYQIDKFAIRFSSDAIKEQFSVYYQKAYCDTNRCDPPMCSNCCIELYNHHYNESIYSTYRNRKKYMSKRRCVFCLTSSHSPPSTQKRNEVSYNHSNDVTGHFWIKEPIQPDDLLMSDYRTMIKLLNTEDSSSSGSELCCLLEILEICRKLTENA